MDLKTDTYFWFVFRLSGMLKKERKIRLPVIGFLNGEKNHWESDFD